MSKGTPPSGENFFLNKSRFRAGSHGVRWNAQNKLPTDILNELAVSLSNVSAEGVDSAAREILESARTVAKKYLAKADGESIGADRIVSAEISSAAQDAGTFLHSAAERLSPTIKYDDMNKPADDRNNVLHEAVIKMRRFVSTTEQMIVENERLYAEKQRSTDGRAKS